ncbi:hypothetical protein BSL82_14010 [Tardibacter chloracetimidivorans]|uniref:Tc1-like transposase DDE domain-containing protein n=1 Tax=Tardibacter chloracetimidivorans TaxID=1921510 RepID=A0A1L3ZXC4_9SPHN|nr:hypothetical protein BSL82_14010 [Tardibacter chloracetimidivorans]
MILDDLAAHKSEKAKAVAKELLFLPASSPDLSPIEMAFPNSRTTSDGSACGPMSPLAFCLSSIRKHRTL